MIGIQFGVYEFMKRVMIQRHIANEETKQSIKMELQQQQQFSTSFDDDADTTALEVAMMDVAASQNHPNPVPHISKHRLLMNGKSKGTVKSKKNNH
jgi:hypothetical protein